MPLEAALFAPGCHIPEPCCLVGRFGHQASSVRREGNRPDSVGMPLEAALFAPGCHIPQPRRLVPRPGGEALPVRREDDRPDPFSWPSKRRSSRPVATSHSRAVLSPDAVASLLPSGAKATESTSSPWPSRQHSSRPVATSHNRAVSSSDPVARLRPSGAKATVAIVAMALEAAQLAPGCHIPQPSRLVVRPSGEATPFGAKATDMTPSLCPSKRRNSRPVATSHSRAVLSTTRWRGLSIRREGDGADHVAMPLEATQLATSRHIP